MRTFPGCLRRAGYLWLAICVLQLQAPLFAADDPPGGGHGADAAHAEAPVGGEHAGAADAHGAAGDHGDAHGAHAVEGPITKKGEDIDLAIWTLIVFAVFVAVLKKFAWGPLNAGLEKREMGILQNIADAESARIKAEKMLAAHAEKLNKVQDEVREILAEARRDAEHTRDEIVAAAKNEADASRQRAIQEIDRARDLAVSELFSHMSQAVANATEQVLGRTLTSEDHDRLIREALSDVSARRN